MEAVEQLWFEGPPKATERHGTNQEIDPAVRRSAECAHHTDPFLSVPCLVTHSHCLPVFRPVVGLEVQVASRW